MCEGFFVSSDIPLHPSPVGKEEPRHQDSRGSKISDMSFPAGQGVQFVWTELLLAQECSTDAYLSATCANSLTLTHIAVVTLSSMKVL